MGETSWSNYQIAAAADPWRQGVQSAQPTDIFKQLQTAQDAANKANETRYKEILSMYEGLGQAGRTRIQQQTAQQQAAMTQSLTSRGLGGTTITGAMSRGINNDAELQRQQLEEGLTAQKAGVMERKQETGPDLGMYAQLMQAANRGPQRTIVQGSGHDWAWGEKGSTTNPY